MTDIDKYIDILPSSNNHIRLNKWYKSYEHESECDKLEQSLPDYRGIMDFCLNFTGNLKDFSKLSFWGPFENHRCTILNYWAHDQLFNVIIKDSNSDNITKLLSGILPIWNGFFEATKCAMRSQMHIENYFSTMKKLYYYAMDYDTIEGYIRDNGSKCNANIKNYLQVVDNLYNETKGKCNSRRDLECSVLEDIEKVYELDKFKKLDCEVETSSTLPRGLGGQHLAPRPSEDESGLMLGEKTDSMEDSPSNTIAGAIFPIFGSFILFFITYKFTPLKSWIQSRILSRKIIGHNMNEEDINESLENTYENFNAIEEYDHNISYNPL
ncbi:PIR Superfamily Protein [Plasmodium ovale wallikeri]|uniref:PIR Superfamily Protein n=2 Tax=Plasmodium ovale TaxID=36330 RepID=A0A1A9AI45_PLAOA|nr:PIR Superfamily Protein [Plasmodium ovale wallikeri]SBT58640.1 PIR Superfamily Protein [Plasmodium ovale wallikeri]SBT72332.1 PIR protein [Plasmodium ovale]